MYTVLWSWTVKKFYLKACVFLVHIYTWIKGQRFLSTFWMERRIEPFYISPPPPWHKPSYLLLQRPATWYFFRQPQHPIEILRPPEHLFTSPSLNFWPSLFTNDNSLTSRNFSYDRKSEVQLDYLLSQKAQFHAEL